MTKTIITLEEVQKSDYSDEIDKNIIRVVFSESNQLTIKDIIECPKDEVEDIVSEFLLTSDYKDLTILDTNKKEVVTGSLFYSEVLQLMAKNI